MMRGETDRAILDEIALRIDKSIKMIFQCLAREKKVIFGSNSLMLDYKIAIEQTQEYIH